MDIKIIKKPISKGKLKKIAKKQFGDLVKAVVDVSKEIMAIGGELHSDEEIFLIEKERSKHKNLWGINIYPKKTGKDFIEFDSMINLKPAFGNRSRNVESRETKEKIRKIIKKLISE